MFWTSCCMMSRIRLHILDSCSCMLQRVVESGRSYYTPIPHIFDIGSEMELVFKPTPDWERYV